jgi:RND family efflux transporter MFP subunit
MIWRGALWVILITALQGTLVCSAEPEHVEVDGVIEPHMVVNVGSAVPGILESVKVDRGDRVKEGQVLATLESGVEEATMKLAKAKAEMDAAVQARQEELAYGKRTKDRTKMLYDEAVAPLKQMDEAQTNETLAEMALREALEKKQLAELEYQQAKAVVKRRTILSPISGVVVERLLSPGEYVKDQPIMKLAQIDPLNVEVIVPVELLRSIEFGMGAEVRPESPVGGVYTGEVKIVDGIIDARSGTFGVRVELPNPDYRLPAGLKCRVRFVRQ